MSLPGSIAVTGANGRLGRSVVAALRERGITPHGWKRPDYDLDSPAVAAQLIDRDRPELVIHCAAWTDVDGCAREPRLAMARNAGATEALAIACEQRRVALVVISSNEVFDGTRGDRRGYAESDGVGPINAYGRSKLAAEEAARSAFGRYGPPLWIVRSSWLFGPPGNDFPAKILAAADRLEPGEAVRVVGDEFGTPTYSDDLADALLELITVTPPDLYHLVPPGAVSRFEFARAVIATSRPGAPIVQISRSEFSRASEPPPWGVLDASYAASRGVQMRDWRVALREYLSGLP